MYSEELSFPDLGLPLVLSKLHTARTFVLCIILPLLPQVIWAPTIILNVTCLAEWFLDALSLPPFLGCPLPGLRHIHATPPARNAW